MKKLFVPYELAVKLKEMNFDLPCWKYFYTDGKSKNAGFDRSINRNIYPGQHSQPLYQEVINWLEEKYNTHIEPVSEITESGDVTKMYRVLHVYKGQHPNFPKSMYSYIDYRCGTLDEAIDKAFDYVKLK